MLSKEAKWGERPSRTRPELRSKSRWRSGDTEAVQGESNRMHNVGGGCFIIIAIDTSFFCLICAFKESYGSWRRLEMIDLNRKEFHLCHSISCFYCNNCHIIRFVLALCSHILIRNILITFYQRKWVLLMWMFHVFEKGFHVLLPLSLFPSHWVTISFLISLSQHQQPEWKVFRKT